MRKTTPLFILLTILFVGCNALPEGKATRTAIAYMATAASWTATPTITPTHTPTPTSTNTPTITPTPTPLPMVGPVTEKGMIRLGKGWVNDLTFSPNGMILSVATSIGVYLYQVETMKLITFLPSNAFVKDTVFIDDETLVTGAGNGTTIVWDIKNTPKLLETLQRSEPVVRLYVDDDKSILVVEPGPYWGPGNVVKWDRTNPEDFHPNTSGHISGGAYSSTKNLLALANGNVFLVDTQKMKTIVSLCGGQCNPDALAFSPTGEMWATQEGRGAKSKITIWDTAKMEKAVEIKTPETYTLDLTFSPDGKMIASASLTGLDIWNIDSKELIFTFESASSIAFSPNGSLIASASPNGDITLRDVSSGDKILMVKGFTPISQVAFQNEYIAATLGSYGPRDGADIQLSYFQANQHIIILRNISTGEIVRTFSSSEENSVVNSFSFSPDGKAIASTWVDKNASFRALKNSIILFDVNSGEQIKTLNGFGPIAFSPDGSMLATSTKDRQLIIWDIASGQTLPLSLGIVPQGQRQPAKKSLVFSPDGSMIAILSDNVILRDLSTGRRIKTLVSGLDPYLGFFGFCWGCPGAIGEFSPDGTILVSTWLLPTDIGWGTKGVIILWDVTSGQKTAVLEGHTKPITGLAISPDGTLLASGAEDNTIIIWDLRNGSMLKALQGHTGAINSLAFSHDGTLLYSGSFDGTVIIWSLDQLLP